MSSCSTPGSCALSATPSSLANALPGGTVAEGASWYEENSRFTSSCSRLISVKGSEPAQLRKKSDVAICAHLHLRKRTHNAGERWSCSARDLSSTPIDSRGHLVALR